MKPKITRRDCKVVRTEDDPYQSDHSDRLPRLFRKIYEDGSCELFAGDARVVAVDADRPWYPPASYVCHLTYDDGRGTVISACSDEATWLKESLSLRRIPQ